LPRWRGEAAVVAADTVVGVVMEADTVPGTPAGTVATLCSEVPAIQGWPGRMLRLTALQVENPEPVTEAFHSWDTIPGASPDSSGIKTLDADPITITNIRITGMATAPAGGRFR